MLYGIAYRGGCVVAVCVYALSEVVVIVVCELLLNAATYLTCAQFRNYIIAPFMVKSCTELTVESFPPTLYVFDTGALKKYAGCTNESTAGGCYM